MPWRAWRRTVFMLSSRTDGRRGEMAEVAPRVACVGECMIELAELDGGRLARTYGGDTLNTAVYLARLGVDVDYVTALGDDPFSNAMLDGWREEGVGTGHVLRLPNRLPGLYLIRRDACGERSFFYWRDRAPARDLFELPETPAISEALAEYGLLYLSGITLSLYGEAGRERLLQALEHAVARGVRVAFDTNFRPRGWPDFAQARSAYRRTADFATFVLASTEDLELLFGNVRPMDVMPGSEAGELVLKLPELACRIFGNAVDEFIAVEPIAEVVDTTAAGDSFAAAYIAARLQGAAPVMPARAGHRLAGTVVGYPGAIIPRESMPAAFVKENANA
jgi:2-dehydro-3-deoxygluconokinase